MGNTGVIHPSRGYHCTMGENAPRHLDLKKEKGLSVTWSDGTTSYYPIEYLRKMSPSADMREMRRDLKTNPLAVLPDKYAHHPGPLTALDAELIGNYALRIRFSDGHDTGIYSWEYLRGIDPQHAAPGESPGGAK